MPEKKKNRTFESDMLGLPPLKMVLSEPGQSPKPARKKRLPSPEELNKEDTIWRIIERLAKKE